MGRSLFQAGFDDLRPAFRLFAALLVILAAVGAAIAVTVGGPKLVFLVFAAPILLVGTHIGLVHPQWIRNALAFTLGALPLAHFPGFPLPVIFGFGIAVLLATLVHRSAVTTMSALELVVVLLILTSAFSVVPNMTGFVDLNLFSQWFVATAVMIALLRLPRDQLRGFGRVFVYGAAVGSVFGILNLLFDPPGKMIAALSPFGYAVKGDTGRYVFTGDVFTTRLAGSYIDPNAAGIILFVALLVCVITCTGSTKVILATLIGSALALTLSRSAIFSLVAGVLLMLLFQRLRASQRISVIAGFVVITLLAAAVPVFNSRIFRSFSTDDVGAAARADALRDYPIMMEGHWLFGLGWGRREFFDPATTFVTNFVANSPLLTIYRGGLLVGLVFCLALIVGIVNGYRCMRSDKWEYGLMGGGFIGFVLIALQLDYPVVTIPPITMAFAVLLTFLVHTLRESQLPGSNSVKTLGEAHVLDRHSAADRP